MFLYSFGNTYVMKRCWIRHIARTVYRTWQVIPNCWELAKRGTYLSPLTDFLLKNEYYIKSLVRIVLCRKFNVWLSHSIEFIKTTEILLVLSFFYHFFPSQFSTMFLFSPQWHSLQSIQTHKHITIHTCANEHAQTYCGAHHTQSQQIHMRHQPLHFFLTNTPLVAISATLLSGANQSYNTFIISTSPQAPSCWVKSHLGLFGCFTAEIRNYITDMEGLGLAGSSHWQLDTKQTRCELCWRRSQCT